MIQQLDLNGTWKLRWSDYQRGRPEYANRDVTDPTRYIDAKVPGEVHLDCIKAGLIAEPTLGMNHLAARWVEENIWSYRREIEAPAEALAGNARAWLVFDGLDYAASIVLNGVEVGKHKNVFYPCRVEITGKLRAGKNVLAVHLDPGLWEVADKPVAGWQQDRNQPLHKRHWLRKPQCQFSWDWSTRLINCGIFKPCRLEYTTDTARLDQLSPLVTVSDDLQTGTVNARIFCEGFGDKPQAAKLRVRLPEVGIDRVFDVEIKPGLHPLAATVHVAHPQLWWPVGYGTQPRYQLQASVEIGGVVIGEKSTRIGFRRVEVDQRPHPQKGRYFIIRVNNTPIFCKGGNFVPADMIFARIDRQRYQTLVERALEANFNFLRIWGGGMYESDDFYDLCDEHGILVWQEFIFACGRFPSTDHEFLEDVKREAAFNIRRLAEHPSLVVWCGNNEIEGGDWSWAAYQVGVRHPDYALYHLVLPRLMKQEDPTRYYQPSSPYSPDMEDPNADETGDQHPWSLGFWDNDFRKYRGFGCRFPNEGGILGPTSLPTMQAALVDGQRFVQSLAWQQHDNSVDSWHEPSRPDEMIRTWLGHDPLKLSIEEFTYWAGLLHGEGLAQYIENFRRRKFDTSSAIFWMYNDCWPATRSWTTVDYYLNRTPAFWAVKRAMQPVHVVLVEQDGRVDVFGVNDTLAPVSGQLRFGVMNLAGGYPVDQSARVEIPANASKVIGSFAAEKWADHAGSFGFALLSDAAGKMIVRNRIYTPLFKDISWPASQVKVKLEHGQAIFTADKFAWGVCIDLDGREALADNFFDVWPGIPHVIAWSGGDVPIVKHKGN